MMSEIVHPVLRYLLIGASPFVALIVLAMVAVAFADADVRPMKLNYLDAEPDEADAAPEMDEHAAVDEEEREFERASSADDEEPDRVFARRGGRAR